LKLWRAGFFTFVRAGIGGLAGGFGGSAFASSDSLPFGGGADRAWVLAGNIARYGPTWRAVGAYNARSLVKRKGYVAKVWRRYRTSKEAES